MSKLDDSISKLVGKALTDPETNSDLELKVINYDPTAAASFRYDSTEVLSNTINDASNRATLKRVEITGTKYTYMYVGSTRPIIQPLIITNIFPFPPPALYR